MEKVTTGEEWSKPDPPMGSTLTTPILESLFKNTETSLEIEVGEIAGLEVGSKSYPIEEDMVNLEKVKPLLELGLLGLSSEIEYTSRAREVQSSGDNAPMKVVGKH